MRLLLFILICALGSFANGVWAKGPVLPTYVDKDSSKINHPTDMSFLSRQLDIIDICENILHRGFGKRSDTTQKSRKLRISAGPSPEYSLSTGIAGVVASNATFFFAPDANASVVYASTTYTQKNQLIVPIQSCLFTKGNKYNIVTDWCYYYYPSLTFGLGGYTTLADGYQVIYSQWHFRQTVVRNISNHLYAGLGYNYDCFYNITEMKKTANAVTDFDKYGYAKTEFASGVTCNFTYDTRTNPLNSTGGYYVNVVFCPYLKVFGNMTPWTSFLADLRKYVRFPASSNNVLAFWSYEWLTPSGKPPYLMLPYTGGDSYSNLGRGYIQGRFRGSNMVYAESEYRFGILNNGFLGGVVFVNAESFTEQSNNKFETIAPACGAGIRIKFNKFSKANVAFDYGFGMGGSHGAFVNLGEVF